MRVLAIAGDEWHSADLAAKGLRGLERFGFEVDWVEDVDDRSAIRLAEFCAVILCKADFAASPNVSPWLSEGVQRQFLSYVQNGGGLLVLHSGAAVDENAGRMHELIGGYFLGHPEQCPVNFEPHGSHPLAAGFKPFVERDEQYFMRLDDESVDVFLTTSSEHGTQPGGWTVSRGSGRVCVLTPGHNEAVWLHPGYQELLSNAAQWCVAASRPQVKE